MSNLEVIHLSKRFGRVQALTDVTLEIEEGEFMVMLGPTAAGKTTTLRCVAGLEKMNEGIINMDGQTINGLSPAERDLAFVFQTYALYPRKTAFQNMAFPLQSQGWAKEKIRQRVEAVAAKLRISELLDRRPAAMSGGQQQRVALGRAMVRQPRMFLMDEPLTNLDFKLRVEMRSELKRLQKELGTTFFYVTNDQVEAMSMADRMAVLNKGVLQQIDKPETIYDHPANLFVAQFVGNPRMNTLTCTYDAGQRVLNGTNNAWQVALNSAQQDCLAQATTSDDLVFGVRAEDISIVPQGTNGAVGGSVYVLEPLGDRTFVDIHIQDETIKLRAEPDFTANEGDAVWMQFDLDRIHVFDKQTGKTIF